MENPKEVIELVVYRIKPEQKARYVQTAIESFRQLVMGFEGFISYGFYGGSRDENLFMDFVRWQSLEHAENAAQQVKIIQQQPAYKDYLAAFEKLEIFNHFNNLKFWVAEDAPVPAGTHP